MELLELLKRGEIAVERTGVGSASDAGKIGSLVIGPGIGDSAACGSGVTESVSEMSEFAGDAIGLEIGDIEVGAIDGPLLEITTDNFGVVGVVGFVGGERERCEEEDGERTEKHRETTDFHRTHLGAKELDEGTIDLYSGGGKSDVLVGKRGGEMGEVIYSGEGKAKK